MSSRIVSFGDSCGTGGWVIRACNRGLDRVACPQLEEDRLSVVHRYKGIVQRGDKASYPHGGCPLELRPRSLAAFVLPWHPAESMKLESGRLTQHTRQSGFPSVGTHDACGPAPALAPALALAGEVRAKSVSSESSLISIISTAGCGMCGRHNEHTAQQLPKTRAACCIPS
jgi:hypothetical protein